MKTYVGVVLTRGFEENKLVDIDADFPSDRLPHSEEYDYFSDSDLEDEDSLEDSQGEPGASASNHDVNDTLDDEARKYFSDVCSWV